MEFLGDFYGSHLRAVTLDATVLARVKPHNWGDVSTGYETKWYGYRYLSPGQSLFLFADRYRKAVAKVRRDHAVSGIGLTSVTALAEVSDAQFTGYWTAMNMADVFGIPYDFFCESQINFASRMGHKYMPTPQKMFTDSALYAVKQEWDKQKVERFIRTEDPHYTVSKHAGPWQDDYQDYLLNLVEARHSKARALASVVYEKPQVLPSKAAERLGVEVVKEAKSIARLSS